MSYPIEKYRFYEYLRPNADGTTSKCVAAVSTYAGRTVKGVAACQSSDAYNLQNGKELSAARCDLKVCIKRRDRAARKVSEAKAQLEAAARHLERMQKYYSDSLDECVASVEHLRTLENNLEYFK